MRFVVREGLGSEEIFQAAASLRRTHRFYAGGKWARTGRLKYSLVAHWQNVASRQVKSKSSAFPVSKSFDDEDEDDYDP